MSKKPEPMPPVRVSHGPRPTSPPPPRKRVFPAVSLVGVDALAVGQIVDQLEDTIRVLLARQTGSPHTAITRKEIEAAIVDAEIVCAEGQGGNHESGSTKKEAEAIELLSDITGDAAFSGFSDSLKERIYSFWA